ncbi:MAG: hypothetical protein ACUVWS_17635 [Roseiflexus sp.]
MTEVTLTDLQASIRDTNAFNKLQDYFRLCHAFLELIKRVQPTRIISPTHNHYVFYQYDKSYGYKITRPLNTNLFIESEEDFKAAFERFMSFLYDLRQYQDAILDQGSVKGYVKTSEVNKVVYTIQ